MQNRFSYDVVLGNEMVHSINYKCYVSVILVLFYTVMILNCDPLVYLFKHNNLYIYFHYDRCIGFIGFHAGYKGFETV